jgi:hypothetical protein
MAGPADNLPSQNGQLVDPSGPANGPRWPSDNFLTLQIQTLWSLERAERTFAEGLDVAEPIRLWLIGEKGIELFSGLHNRPQRAPDGKGKGARYVSLYTPVDPTPKPPDRGTHLLLQDDTSVLPDLPHLHPDEMREMEMVLRSYWRTEARAPHGNERFKGPPPKELQALGFQAEELAGRVSRWETTEGELGKDRALVNRAIGMRDNLWKGAFTVYDLDPPKPRLDLVTKRGNTVYVVKWTPEPTRPTTTPEAAVGRPSDEAKAEPTLIWTRERSPGVGPLRSAPPSTAPGGQSAEPTTGPIAQAEGAPGGQIRAGSATTGADIGPTTSRAQTTPAATGPPQGSAAATGPVTVRQVLNESRAQATQQLAAALPNYATASNNVAQLQALLQNVLARAEAQRPGITTRPILWTPPSSPGNEHFPPALYVGAPGEYAVGGADPTPLLSLAEPAARAMLARRLGQLPAHTGTRLNERVRAPIFDVGAREIRVNGKPLEGIAILDTGAMPLLIGRAGMAQMGWTSKDDVPNAVRLGLADGASIHLHGLTRKTVKFTFNPGTPTTISIAVRAVVTDAPYDFLVGRYHPLDHWRHTRRLEGGVALPRGLAEGAQLGRRQGRPGFNCVHQGPLGPRFCQPRSSAPPPGQ